MRLPKPEDISRAVPGQTRQIVGYQAGLAERGTQALGGALQQAGEIVQKEIDYVDDAKAEDAINQAKMKALELSDGEGGFSHIKGEGVVGKDIGKQYNQRYDQALQAIEANLDNPEQINRFRRRVQATRLAYQSGLMNHISNETSEYQRGTDAATIDIEINAAAASGGNPAAIQDARARIEYTLNRAADREGLSAQERKVLIGDNITNMHLNVINSLSATDPDSAEAYYKANRKEINAVQRTEIEAALQEKTVAAYAQREADRISGLDLSDTEKLAEARKEKDADKQKALVSEVKVRIAESVLESEDAKDEANRILMGGGTIDDIPDEVRLKLRQSEWNALVEGNRKLREGKKPVQDWKKWTEFNETLGAAERGDKDALKKLKTMNVFALREDLDDSHYNSALTMRRSILHGDAKQKAEAKAQFTNVVNSQAKIEDMLSQMFGRKTKKQWRLNEHRYADLLASEAQREFDEWAIENPGVKMPGSVRDAILLNLMRTEIKYTDTGWFSTTEETATLKDIPATVYDSIVQDLRSNNLPTDTGSVLEAWVSSGRPTKPKR